MVVYQGVFFVKFSTSLRERTGEMSRDISVKTIKRIPFFNPMKPKDVSIT